MARGVGGGRGGVSRRSMEFFSPWCTYGGVVVESKICGEIMVCDLFFALRAAMALS